MLMVITGAGASHDSVDGAAREITHPPLAKELFSGDFTSKRTSRQSCKALLPGLQRAVERGENIEDELEVISLDAGRSLRVKGQLLDLRRYIRDVVTDTTEDCLKAAGRTTNYSELLGRIGDWHDRHGRPVCFVTFNYDQMLDEACADVLGMTLGDPARFVGNADFNLLKVHGSVKWMRRIEREDGELINSFDDFLFGRVPFRWTPGYYPWDDERTENQYLGDPRRHDRTAAFVPAIAVPTRSKSEREFECPEAHLEALKEALPQVTDLLVIGWRAQEQHFLGLWKKAVAGESKFERALIVTSKRGSAEKVMSQLVDGTTIDSAKVQLSEAGGFTESLRTGEIARFLDGSPSRA